MRTTDPHDGLPSSTWGSYERLRAASQAGAPPDDDPPPAGPPGDGPPPAKDGPPPWLGEGRFEDTTPAAPAESTAAPTGPGCALEAALDLLARGFCPVVLKPAGMPQKDKPAATGKEPFGPRWGLGPFTAEKLRGDARICREHGEPGVGVTLGPGRAPGGRWLADLEGDGPEAEESLAKLLGGEVLETLGWSSARGRHRLVALDADRILHILPRIKGFETKDRNSPGVFKFEEKLPGLELRLGGYKQDSVVKQLQSACPPTVGTDGRHRRWDGAGHVAEAPEAFYAALEQIAVEAAARSPEAPGGHPRPHPHTQDGTPPKPSRGADAWLRAALRNAVSRIEATEKGGRYYAYRDESYCLAGYLHYGVGYTEDELYQTLAGARAKEVDPNDPNIPKAVREAIAAGKARPLELPRSVLDGKPSPPPPKDEGCTVSLGGRAGYPDEAPPLPPANGMAAPSVNGHADGAKPETAPETTDEATDTGPPPTVEELLRRAGEFTLLSQVLADTEFLEGLARREVGDAAGAGRVLLALREGLGKKFAVKPFKAAMERYRRAARAAAGGDARPDADEAIEADHDPHRLARVVAATYPGHLARFRGDYMRYRGTHWEADPDFAGETLVVEVKEEVDLCAAEALDRWKRAVAEKTAIEARGGTYDGDIGPKPKAIRVTRALIADVDQALGSMVTTGCRDEPPFWLDRMPGDPDPTKIVAVRNGLLDLSGPAPVLRPHDRRFFSPICLPFDYDPKAPTPPLWHSLLHEQWGGDMETLETIDEMIGYLLLPDTSQQKIFLLLGPPRSGRGTMIRVITELLGRENIIDTTPASLADPFGLQGFLGKTIAIMADARTQDSETLAVVMNRLLSISGEDRIPVNQKNRPILSVKLNTRILIVSNEVPTFRDQSGAIVARYIIINADHEVPPERRDPDLDKKIVANELPGILNLAIEGFYRLRDRGRFRQPDSAGHLVDNARDIASPIRSYVGQRCTLAPGSAVEKARLFNDWCSWCEPRKYQPGNEAIFLKNLYAACPTVRAARRRSGDDRIQVLQGIDLRDP